MWVAALVVLPSLLGDEQRGVVLGVMVVRTEPRTLEKCPEPSMVLVWVAPSG